MKITAIFMAALMLLSLTGCMAGGRTAADGTTPSGMTGDSGDASGNGGGSGAANGANGGMGGGSDTGNDSTMGPVDANNGSDEGAMNVPENVSGSGNGGGASSLAGNSGRSYFYYAGRLYRVTDETVNSGDVGAELFSITDIVQGNPAAEGEGYGLDRDSYVYKFRDENQYDELIVMIGDRYYKAEVSESDLIPSVAGGSGGMSGNNGMSGSGSGSGGNSGGGTTGGMSGGISGSRGMSGGSGKSGS